MTRAYFRMDPNAYERKVIQQGYSVALYGAFCGVLGFAEHQPVRGVFRDERLLKALLGPAGRLVGELVSRRDLILRPDGSLYVDGWDEWQEGDWKVGERVRRIRGRKGTVATVTPTVTPTVTGTVDNPSDGDRQSVIDGGGAAGQTPQPPSRGGRRADGTNDRALAARLTAENNRADRERLDRRKVRQRAYLDGRLTEAQRDEMNDADAPVEDIPAERGAAYVRASA